RYLFASLPSTASYALSLHDALPICVQVIETDFGRLNLMLNRHMPADTVAVVSLEQCAPVYHEIPGKGHFFAEPLALTGAYERKRDRKSTRLNSSHVKISYAVFCLKK